MYLRKSGNQTCLFHFIQNAKNFLGFVQTLSINASLCCFLSCLFFKTVIDVVYFIFVHMAIQLSNCVCKRFQYVFRIQYSVLNGCILVFCTFTICLLNRILLTKINYLFVKCRHSVGISSGAFVALSFTSNFRFFEGICSSS